MDKYKTAEEKAKTLAATIGVKSPELVWIIARAIKQQDRDTRHACAEAVLTLDKCRTSSENAIYNSAGDIVDKAICADQAHGACMNVKAV